MSDVNTSRSVKYVDTLYSSIGYFDEYGSSVFIVGILTSVLVITVFIFYTLETVAKSSSDWESQRCKVPNAFIGGLVHKVEGKTAFEYSKENFKYCVQSMSNALTNAAVSPLYQTLMKHSAVTNMHQKSVDHTRSLLSNVRSSISSSTDSIYARLMNVVIAIQKIMIGVQDSIGKAHGTVTAATYTSLGTYFTLKSFIGSVLNLIVKSLLIMTIIIVALWVVPFTWGAAGVMTASFLAVSIPLAVTAAFMTEILGVHSSPIPKLRCFDKDTKIQMRDGTFKCISDIKCGEYTAINGRVNTTLILDAFGLDMYNLFGTIVSGCHRVYYDSKVICVRNHPSAQFHNRVTDRQERVYCISTESKRITVFGIDYLDWDEWTHDMNIDKCMYAQYDGGFETHEKVCANVEKDDISALQIGDMVDNSTVYGTVRMINHNRNVRNCAYPVQTKCHVLTYPQYFTVNNVQMGDYNISMDKFLSSIEIK